MKLFDLFEERRNPELNPHMNPIDVLWMHANKPDVYVTFTNIEKVGINPKSHYKFNTPIGIYSYPISYVAEFTEKRTKQGELVVPYRANADWVTIFKQTGRILDSSNYNAGDLANDREKLMDYFDDWFDRNFNDPQTKIKEIFHDHGLSVGFYNLESLFDFYAEEAKVRTPAGIIWAITYFLSNDLAQYFNTHPPIIWTKMFINILDYDAVHDTGYAIIHENEPTQAVHFDRSTLDIIEMMENKVKVPIDKSFNKNTTVLFNGGGGGIRIEHDHSIDALFYYSQIDDQLIMSQDLSVSALFNEVDGKAYQYLKSFTMDKVLCDAMFTDFHSVLYRSNMVEFLKNVKLYEMFVDEVNMHLESISQAEGRKKHNSGLEYYIAILKLLNEKEVLYAIAVSSDTETSRIVDIITEKMTVRHEYNIENTANEMRDALRDQNYIRFKQEVSELYNLLIEKIGEIKDET